MILEEKIGKTRRIIRSILDGKDDTIVCRIMGRVGELPLLHWALETGNDFQVSVIDPFKYFNKTYSQNLRILTEAGLKLLLPGKNNTDMYSPRENPRYLMDALTWENSSVDIPYIEGDGEKGDKIAHPFLHWYTADLLTQLEVVGMRQPRVLDFYRRSWSKKGIKINQLDRPAETFGGPDDDERKRIIENLKNLGYM